MCLFVILPFLVNNLLPIQYETPTVCGLGALAKLYYIVWPDLRYYTIHAIKLSTRVGNKSKGDQPHHLSQCMLCMLLYFTLEPQKHRFVTGKI